MQTTAVKLSIRDFAADEQRFSLEREEQHKAAGKYLL
jgi:hypothetical protein